ncbi:hypothetical protein CRYUN_Cryun29cG0015300 [Craigia yunnanensis]
MERVVKSLAFIAIAAMVLAIATTDAQSICNMPASGLMACKPAVTPPNPPPPTSTCCSALSHADLRCLCSYKKSNLLPSLGIDPNLAMQLPSLCKLPHPVNC